MITWESIFFYNLECISPFRLGVVTDATADPNDVTKTDGTQAISRGNKFIYPK